MEIALLKSSICLLSFIAFYKVFLEQTSNHHFKRIYLLAVILVSIVIPFITFVEYIEPQSILNNFTGVQPFTVTQQPITQEPTNYTPIVLWSIYGLGVLLFSVRFIHSLSVILLKIKRNPKQKTSNFISVLLKDLVIPHTFFNYIFLNKTKFENNEIPQEVLLHEQTHAKQKHSADILFIECLQIIFWFHPLVYILKKDMKLNHEFLADQAVINQGIESTNYLKTLLSFSSNQQELTLEHAINYSSIKKRFTVMKTQTSKQTFWFRSLLLLPLLAILIFSFSTKKEVEKGLNLDKITKTLPTINDHEIGCNDCKIELSQNDFKNVELNTTTKEKVIGFKIKFPGKPTLTIASNQLDKNAFRYLSENKSLTDIQIFDIKTQKEILDSYILVKIKRAKNQKEATAEQLAEYTKLAKLYNLQPEEHRIIHRKDLERLEYLYGLMSKKQKAQAEPFPNCPPPPPAPPVKKGEASLIPPPPPPIPADANPEEVAKYKKVLAEYHGLYEVKNGKVTHRLPPPPPVSTLDHVIEMAKENADFYYEGKKVSSDKAIEIVKNDKDLSISSQTKNVERPIVNITTQPVITDDNGKVITKIETLQEVKSNTRKDRNGYVDINGTVYFYAVKNNETTYFNRYGKKVNEKGALLN